MSLEEQILAALHQVCDPCSIAAHAPISIVDMGLVREWSIDDAGVLSIRMCVTSPSCTMAPNMVQGAEALLRQIEGVKEVRIEVDPTVFWTPAEMTEAGRSKLGFSRDASMSRTGVRPQQWRNAAAANRPLPG